MRDFKFNSIALAALGLAITLQHPSAMAFTRNLGAPPPNCDHANSEHTDFRNLIHKAHIMGNPDGTLDDRRVTMSRAQTVGVQLSREEMQQMMACHGQMVCTVDQGPGQRPRVLSQSAALSLSNSTLRTVSHTFYDQSDRLVIDRMSCEYRPYNGQPQKLDFANTDSLARINPRANRLNDRIAIRLKTPIRGCNPYPAITEPLREGESLIAVTHLQARMNELSGATGREPVVTPGLVGAVYPQTDGSPTGLHLNMTSTQGASGGRLLVRRNGRLYDAGMIVSTPGAEYDGRPYNLAEGMTTMALAMDGGMVDMVRNPEADPTVSASSRPSKNPNANSDASRPLPQQRATVPTAKRPSQFETEYTDI